MKIAFVTSGLEPGRDGVGDYATLLAEECLRRGHEVVRLALNDRQTSLPVRTEALLRLPSSIPWPERAKEARTWLERFGPDCVSLHFVCYGYHPRGLVGRVASHFGTLLRGWEVEVYFHELWIGDDPLARWKDKVMGWLQRRGVFAVLRQLELKVIHTSNPAYVHLLSKVGIQARRLPLFGSLPLPSMEPVRSGSVLTFVLFGTIQPVWPPEAMFNQLRNLGVPLTIVHVGRMGSGEALWDRMTKEYAGVFSFRRLGELSPQEVADVFAAADFGVATTPWALIGKSASVAAMLDAGLPVVVNRDDVLYPGVPDLGEPLLLRMTDDLPAQLCAAKRQPARLRLYEVADQFLEDVEGDAGCAIQDAG